MVGVATLSVTAKLNYGLSRLLRSAKVNVRTLIFQDATQKYIIEIMNTIRPIQTYMIRNI